MKVNENWIMRCIKEAMQLFGDLDILLFMRTSRISVNRMESKRKVSQLSNKNPPVSQLRGRPTADGVIGYRQTL